MMKYVIACAFALTLLKSAISKPSAITRDPKVELPGSEKINRRSPQDYFEVPVSSNVTKVGDSVTYHNSPDTVIKGSPKVEDMEESESGMVFRPLFRSKDHGFKPRVQRSIKHEDDVIKPDETGIVDVSVFRVRDKDGDSHRFRRSTDLKKPPGVVGTPDDLQTAADMAFKPLLRHKQRSARSNLESSIFGNKLVFQNQYS